MQEVEKFQLLASCPLAFKVADFLYFTWVSSDATSSETIFLAFREARVNYIILGKHVALTKFSEHFCYEYVR